MKKTVVIGVMGPGEASVNDETAAFKLGEWIAHHGWITLTGGRASGVMDMACKGARTKKGITIGILPDSNPKGMSPNVLIPIFTDMGSARNNINVLTSDVVIAIAFKPGPGTVSEMALALKADKPLVILTPDTHLSGLFKQLGPNQSRIARSLEEAMELTEQIVANILKDKDFHPINSI